MLLNLPWELFHSGRDFFLCESGCHIVREIRSNQSQSNNSRHNGILHISLGVDSALRLDEERCSLLDILPRELPITFLLNPTLEELAENAETLRPLIVTISGHGSYDDILGVHSIESLEGKLETRQLVRTAADLGCELLLLWTCESARLGVPLQFSDNTNEAPPDLISFTYPVSSGTAIRSIRLLFERLLAGDSVDLAADAARGVDYRDSYAFFNLVHYHQTGKDFFRLTNVIQVGHQYRSLRCLDREFALTVLDVKARENRLTTIVAPVGCGASTLLRHWSDLNSRSLSLRTLNLSSATELRELVRIPSDIGWLVLLGDFDVPQVECGIVRIVAPAYYDGNHSDGVMLVAELEGDVTEQLATALHSDRVSAIHGHPLAKVPMFIERVARGATLKEAQEWFESENHMPERIGQLSDSGRLFASWLYTMQRPTTVGNQTYEEYAEDQRAMGFDPSTLSQGIVDCLAARVVLRIEDSLILAPDFDMLGDKWFPSWKTDHLKPFGTMVAVFATLDNHGKFEGVLGFDLLRWAERIEEWIAASLLCIRLCSEAGSEGHLTQMEPYIRRIRPHVNNRTEQIILDGHLAHILLDEGKPVEALSLHEELEQRARSLSPTEEEYYINLFASMTHQVDCLLALDRTADAETKWNEANDLFARWPGPPEDAQPRLFALKASLAVEAGELEEAGRLMSRAIDGAKSGRGIMIADLHMAKAECLRKQGKFDEALGELELANKSGDAETFASRYLHLKGLILEQAQDQRWLDHILESYEKDLIAGRWEGVAISLLTVARIFIDSREYERARERLREVFTFITTKGLTGQIATFMLLWGEVELATKSPAEARPWFALAQKRASLDGNATVQDRATRLIQ
jgi:tetratricopeptide (TPR) repeat protein